MVTNPITSAIGRQKHKKLQPLSIFWINQQGLYFLSSVSLNKIGDDENDDDDDLFYKVLRLRKNGWDFLKSLL